MLSGEVDMMSALIRIPNMEYDDEFHCPIEDLELALRNELEFEFRSRINAAAKAAEIDPTGNIYCPHNLKIKPRKSINCQANNGIPSERCGLFYSNRRLTFKCRSSRTPSK